MAAIITSKTRSLYGQIPSGPWVLNRGSPLAQGLVGFYPLLNGDVKNYSGVANPVQMTINGAMGTGPTLYGGLGYSNTGDASNFLANTTVAAATAAGLTLNCWFKVRTTTEYGAESCLMSLAKTSATFSSPGDYLTMLYDGANGEGLGAHKVVLDRAGGSSNECSTAALAAASNAPNMATATLISNTSAAVYWNGLNSKSTNTSNITPATWASTDLGCLRQVAAPATTFSPLNGLMWWATIHRFAWTDAMVQYAYDPRTRWDLCYQLRNTVYGFNAAAAGGNRRRRVLLGSTA